MRLHHAIAPLGLAALLAGCGDSLIDHTNVGVRDQQSSQLCDVNQVSCNGVCKTQDASDPSYVCGRSCAPCSGAPANATPFCSPVGDGGHDGVCGFACSAGFLGDGTGCSLPALVAAGGRFSCATDGLGKVHCWGANDQGQLGPGVAATSRPFSGKVQFDALVGVPALAAGPAHACAVAGATTWCWGDATGWGGAASSAIPSAVDALAGVTTLAAGANHTCGITAAGVLKCTGALSVGGGSPSFGIVLDVAAGDSFSCALVAGSPRTVQCWGANDHAQSSGNGVAGSPVTTPASIAMPAGSIVGAAVLHLAAGATHACALTDQTKATDPVVFCWGDDSFHQLGVDGGGGTAVGPTMSRVNKPAGPGPTFIDAGAVTTCVHESDVGSVIQCWGGDPTADGGGTGIGELIDVLPASPVPPGRFSVGGGHSCLKGTDGKLACWGHGAQGQLGNLGLADSLLRVLVVDR
jgi:hypothetical protein